MIEALLILIVILFLYATYQIVDITIKNRKIDKYKKERQEELMFKYKHTLLMIEHLEMIRNFEPDQSVRDTVDTYINHNKNNYRLVSNALTQTQLEEL